MFIPLGSRVEFRISGIERRGNAARAAVRFVNLPLEQS